MTLPMPMPPKKQRETRNSTSRASGSRRVSARPGLRSRHDLTRHVDRPWGSRFVRSSSRGLAGAPPETQGVRAQRPLRRESRPPRQRGASPRGRSDGVRRCPTSRRVSIDPLGRSIRALLGSGLGQSVETRGPSTSGLNGPNHGQSAGLTRRRASPDHEASPSSRRSVRRTSGTGRRRRACQELLGSADCSPPSGSVPPYSPSRFSTSWPCGSMTAPAPAARTRRSLRVTCDDSGCRAPISRPVARPGGSARSNYRGALVDAWTSFRPQAVGAPIARPRGSSRERTHQSTAVALIEECLFPLGLDFARSP